MIVPKTAKTGYPDPFASEKEKRSEVYGMAYAEHIVRYWLGGSSATSIVGNCRYSERLKEIERIERWIKALVDPKQFADLLGIDPDKSSKAFSDKVLAVAANYINRATDRVSDSDYGISVRGTDRYAMELIEAYKDEYRKAAIYEQYKGQFEEVTGVSIPTPDDIPETEEELDLKAELDFKSNYEIAAETSVNRVFELNEFDETRNQCVEDYVKHGEMCAAVQYDNQIGVKIEYIPIRDFISSYNPDNSRNHKDVYYQGRVRRYNILELERKIGRKLTEEERSNLTVNSHSTDAYYRDSETLVYVLEFAFKMNTTKNLKIRYNKRGGRKLIEKESDWSPIEGRESSKISETYETWMGGLHVIGSRLLFNYGELKYMSRTRGAVSRVLPPFIHYKSSTASLGRRLEKIWEDMHIVFMQMEKLVQTMRVSGFAYDIDALIDLDLGDGIMKPAEVVKIFNEGGSYYYSGQSIEGEFQRVPITPTQASDLSSLNDLITKFSFLQRIANDIVGYNEYSDGTANLKGVLSSTSEAAQNATNTATKHIFNGWFSFTRNVAESVINRVQDIIKENAVNEILVPLIGKANLEELRSEYFMHKARFSAIVNVRPNNRDRETVVNMIGQSVQNGTLEPDDAAKLLVDIDNVKRIIQVVGILKRKKLKDQRAYEQQKIAMESQAKQQEIALKAQSDAQLEQMKAQFEQQIEMLKGKNESERLAYDWENQFRLAFIKRDTEVMVANIKGGIENKKENNKAIRSAQEATQQSKIAAAKSGNPEQAMDFEAQKKIEQQLEQ